MEASIEAIARWRKNPYPSDAGIQKVIDGVTTLNPRPRI